MGNGKQVLFLLVLGYRLLLASIATSALALHNEKELHAFSSKVAVLFCTGDSNRLMHIQKPELKTKCSGKQCLGGFLWVLIPPSTLLNILAIVHFVLCPDRSTEEFRRM